MPYYESVDDIDHAIEAYLRDVASGERGTTHGNTVNLIRHSVSGRLAPLKPCLWKGGWRDAAYSDQTGKGAEGRDAWMAALAAGYVPEVDPWAKVDGSDKVRRAELEPLGLEPAKNRYTVFRYVDVKRVESTLTAWFDAEASLRELLGRPNERTEILSRVVEFVYARLYGVYLASNPNEQHVDAWTQPNRKGKRIQIKRARKAASNDVSGVNIKRALLDTEPFDKLALIWMGPEGKIVDFCEATLRELKRVSRKKAQKRAGASFELFPWDVPRWPQMRADFRTRAQACGFGALIDIRDDDTAG